MAHRWIRVAWPALAVGLWACGTSTIGSNSSGTGGTGGTGGSTADGSTGGTRGDGQVTGGVTDANPVADRGTGGVTGDLGTGGLIPKADSGPGGHTPPADGGTGGHPDGNVSPPDVGPPCVPSPEICNDLDDDCDGLIDNADPAGAPLSQVCYDGPLDTAGTGPCAAGQSVCMAGIWQACQGQTLPGVEICDQVDDNCDGQVDNLAMGACLCAPGTVQACYAGPAGTEGVGVCAAGQHTCNADGLGWGACNGQVLPGDEACDGLDNNCNGAVDDALVGAELPCSAGIGACNSAGVTVCEPMTGEIVCNAQAGQPTAETCNGLDDNCDGAVDEGFSLGAPCSVGIGACVASGVMACDAAGGASCNVAPLPPSAETCNSIDDDCDGVVDNGFALGQACQSGVGLCATRGTTICADGSETAPWSFVGVQQNLPEADVLAGGFRECWRGTYDAGGTAIDEIVNGCQGQQLVMACRPVGNPNLTLAALGDRDQVLTPTGNPNADGITDRGHDHNGVHWYFDRDYSWGFAPGGDSTFLTTCDYDDGSQTDADLRLCWHTGGDAIDTGYRCGANDLNNNAGWERIIYARDVVAAGAGVMCDAEPGPAMIERCDGVDNDCDGAVDESDAIDAAPWYVDADGDGYGGRMIVACHQPAGTVAQDGDCDDGNPEIHPGAEELCNSVDDNCDGSIDEPFARLLNAACTVGVGQCAAGGVTICNPALANGAVPWHPSGVLQNLPEADVLAGGFHECFRGTYGEAGATLANIEAACGGTELVLGCRPVGEPSLTLAALGDRDAVLTDTGTPAADGLSDRGHENNGVKWYFNGNFSWGFAPAGLPTNLDSCDFNDGAQPSPELRMCWHTGGDALNVGYRCGDNNLNDGAGWERVVYARDASAVVCDVQPGAPTPETCNGVDDDCDGLTDEPDAVDAPTWYLDADGDGFGGDQTVRACAMPAGYANANLDCNDADPAIKPTAREVCDTVDNNCDGHVDEGLLNACGLCGPTPAEVCNGRDDNCDGTVDNNAPCGAAQVCSGGVCRLNSVVIVYSTQAPAAELDVRTKLQATGSFSRVDEFNAAVNTPGVPFLSQYGAVLVYADTPWGNAATLGDNLANYWDAGGRVVLAVSADASLPVLGRFGTEGNGYILIRPQGLVAPVSFAGIVKLEPASPLLVGVNLLTAIASASSTGPVVNGGTVVATWPDGRPLVVRGTHAGRPLVTLNFYPPSSAVRPELWSGDGVALMRNALLY